MAECLVTRLKASVNDPNLPILGALKLILYTTDGNIIIGAETPGVVEVELLNTTFSDGTKKKTINSMSDTLPVAMTNGDVEVAVYNKSSFWYTFGLKNVDGGLAELTGTKLQELNFSNKTDADFSTAAGASFPYVKSFVAFGGSTAKGDVSALINALSPSKLTTFLFLQNATNLQSFDISLFGKFTKLTELNVSDAKVHGTIEAFVKGQRSYGRTSCDALKMGYKMGTDVTFNGESIPVGDYSNKTLSWTSTTITLGGVTITA